MARDVVAIILYDSKNRFLLQRRTDDAPTNPSKWGFFGGGIDREEDKLKAVIRETFEELEYNIENPKLVYKGTHTDNGKIYVYIEKYDPSKKIQLHEGQDMG